MICERRWIMVSNDIAEVHNCELSICGQSEQYYQGKYNQIIAHEYAYNIADVTHISKTFDNNMLNIMLLDSDDKCNLIFNVIQYANSLSRLYPDNKDLHMLYVASDCNASLLSEIFTTHMCHLNDDNGLTAKICTIDNIDQSVFIVKAYVYDNLHAIIDEASAMDEDMVKEAILNILDNTFNYLMDYINMYINTRANSIKFTTSICDIIAYIKNMATQASIMFDISDLLNKYVTVASIKQIPSSTLFNYLHFVRLFVDTVYCETNRVNNYAGFKIHQQIPGMTRIMPKFNDSINILNGNEDGQWKTMIFDYGEGRQVIQIVHK